MLVEFLIAAVPLMISFFSFLQLSQIMTARLVVKHAAIVGARAASVISNKNGTTPDQKPGDNFDAVEKGVRFALGPWDKTMKSLTVKVADTSTCDDPYGLVTVTVDAEYRCSVPGGGFWVCGIHDYTHPIHQQFSFPHQGARYAEGGGSKCGNN